MKNGVFMMQGPISNQTNTLPSDRRLNSVSSNQPISKYMDDSLLTSSVNSLWSDNHTVNRQNSCNVQKLPTIPAWTGYHPSDRMNDSLLFYSKDTTLGSAHSRDDDECTTTSGSYTINPDDIDDSFDNRPRDMFV